MVGTRELVRKSRLEQLEVHQGQVDRFMGERLNELKREIVITRHAEDVLYRMFMAHTLRGRFLKLVAWLSKPKRQKTVQRARKEEAAGRGIIQEPERAGGIS